MKYLSSILVLLIAVQLNAQEIKVNPGKYSDYYHMKYELTSGNYSVNTEYGFNQGGQFEVFVPKKYFPIAAPACNENIIIRMSYSNSEERKRALYNELLLSKTITVTLELNPYIKVLNKDPLELELQHCNVFFRHKAGDYFDQL
ncbi:hypothetical protein GCM10008107_20280 [Psychrosphaera saromensis]|uniref:Uncharacterized protein n=1 Tax=Psychrosphaera saromensis TaxID=716813 RepID=A0A2S7USK7_9GAMM|nr:hypothetical protein [Psychrosphaera saromensis]PQJ52728.1 hypothetical protein BTO11_03025 [Psychrosphaera saromensis]GHB70766.1 hypothetical protein GCM10008107_20280 [Psychrosphaera saromensis]GLQ13214.1 hypothetical protein GCM10007917_06690 [Psychrosphaera saromensis]